MTPLTDKEYSFIKNLIYDKSRIDLGDNKRELVSSRLGKRLRATQKNSYQEYLKFLQTDNSGTELTHLIDAISTNHTYFFREYKHFEFLDSTVLPWHSTQVKKSGKRPFKVWSCASSSGEEPYSLAVHLEEYAQKDKDFSWTIDATDISTNVLDKARKGIYAEERLKEVRKDQLANFFQKGTGKWDGHYRVKDPLRSQVNFHHLNLLQTKYPFQKPFDVIFVRNVMIYFDRETQEQLVNQLHNILRPGGYLMIGHSESLTNIRHPFQTMKPAIYRKNETSR